MGEMADMALDRAYHEESLADEYVCGGMSMEDAYEHGFLDPTGTEIGMDEFWTRNPIPTQESLAHQLEVAELQLQVASKSGSAQVRSMTALDAAIRLVQAAGYTVLNKAATKNLTKESPTCNVCGEDMLARTGQYGKFYYCKNSCAAQKCVSDSYWQSIKGK